MNYKIRKKYLYCLIIFILLVVLFIAPVPLSLFYDSNARSVRILDRNDKVLYVMGNEKGKDYNDIKFGEISKYVIDALVVQEDKNFYKHFGISIPDILRALWQNILAGRVVSGASTITQQLVKNKLNFSDRGYLSKIYEMILAVKYELYFSKDQILENYLNTVYFGNRAYGINEASLNYFGKTPKELSLSESAILIGIIQSPIKFNPIKNPDIAIDKRNKILGLMLDAKLINKEQYEVALSEPVETQYTSSEMRAPHFVNFVINDLGPDLYKKSEIKTTLDIDLNDNIQNLVRQNVEGLKNKNVDSAAVVILNVKTGDVLAMVGSKDFNDDSIDGQVNATIANRQPGSTLKPFTYALAIEKGETPATTVEDIETRLFTQDGNPFVPRNYDYNFHGLVRYREALANSYNVPAVKVLEKVGISKLLDVLAKSGITTLGKSAEFYGLALTLGSGEVKLLELANAYGVFARGGMYIPYKIYPDKNISATNNIFSKETSFLISDILSDQNARIEEFGEDNPLNIEGQIVAAKTGTTRNSRDNWVIGYTQDFVVGVWVGNPDNTTMKGTSGITGAGPIFHDVMTLVLQNARSYGFVKPDDIKSVEVCKLSGKLPTEDCKERISEDFVIGTDPKDYDNIWKKIKIDTRNSLLATDKCEPEFVTTNVFAFLPPTLTEWQKMYGWNIPPTQYSHLCGESKIGSIPNESFINIISPYSGDSFKRDPLIPDNNEKFKVSISASNDIQKVSWYVDDRFIMETNRPDLDTYFPLNIFKQGLNKIKVKSNTVETSINVFIE